MSEQGAAELDRPSDGSGGVLTPEQRETFRSAGVWMGILGGIEVLAGAIAAVAWGLTVSGVVPAKEAIGPNPADWIANALLTVAALGIGILTLIAARSFRRTARIPDAGLAAVTEAVSDLRELYERQVWVTVGLLVVAIGGVFLWR